MGDTREDTIREALAASRTASRAFRELRDLERDSDNLRQGGLLEAALYLLLRAKNAARLRTARKTAVESAALFERLLIQLREEHRWDAATLPGSAGPTDPIERLQKQSGSATDRCDSELRRLRRIANALRAELGPSHNEPIVGAGNSEVTG